MLLVVIAGISWLVALLLLLLSFPARFSLVDGLLLLSLFSTLPFSLPLGCLLLIRVGAPSRLRFRRVWGVYDERLQFMSRQDVSLLDVSLGTDDVSLAWLVWSRTAEAALADAFSV